MDSISLPMLEEWLGDSVIWRRAGVDIPRCTGGIRLLDDGDGLLQSGFLYVARAESVRQAVEKRRFGQQAVLVISTEGDLTDAELPPSLTLMETRLELITLYNHLQERIDAFRAWVKALRQVVYANGGLQRLLEVAAEEIEATILLVNPGYRHIASVVSSGVEEPTARELQEHGYLGYETVYAIHHETTIRQSEDGSLVEYISRASGNYTIVRLIRYQDNLVARLCFVLGGSQSNAYYTELTAVVADCATQYMLSQKAVLHGANAAFSVLAEELIEYRLTDPEELERRLKQSKLAVSGFYHVLLVQLNDCGGADSIQWNYTLSRLERIFPHSSIATYRGQALMVVRQSGRGKRLEFDEARLLRTLNRYDGYVAVGGAAERLTALPPLYHQAKDTLRIGQGMDPDRRIFYEEDYSMYRIAELAARPAEDAPAGAQMMQLCAREVLELMAYDRKHGSDLAEVLKTYLRNERNATVAARLLYIHRNTMLYKVNKIEEIIGASLDDAMLRERLLFSYRVLEYMNRYPKMESP